MDISPKKEQTLARELTTLKRALGDQILAALADPHVVEIIADADGSLSIDKIGVGLYQVETKLTAADRDMVIRLVASMYGEIITRERPHLAATLPMSGERFQGVIAPMSPLGPTFTIRKPSAVVRPLSWWEDKGDLSAAYAGIIRQAVVDRENILVVGGTGSGKTTRRVKDVSMALDFLPFGKRKLGRAVTPPASR